MRSVETRISTAGIFRCCLAHDNWPDNMEYELGDRRRCIHCGQTFELIVIEDKKHPYWIPVGEEENNEDKDHSNTG